MEGHQDVEWATPHLRCELTQPENITFPYPCDVATNDKYNNKILVLHYIIQMMVIAMLQFPVKRLLNIER